MLDFGEHQLTEWVTSQESHTVAKRKAHLLRSAIRCMVHNITSVPKVN